jgi:hypothetical protein
VDDRPAGPQSFAGTGACLEMFPLAAMVVDRSQRILAINRRGRVALAVGDDGVGRRPGEVIGCVVARRHGCNQSEQCRACILWQSVEVVLRDETAVQREFSVEVAGAEDGTRKVFLASAGPARGPLADHGGRVVVVLQDITLLHRLSGLVPICATCKRVRRPDHGWEAVETFVAAHSHALFSHTFCPDCLAHYEQELHGDVPRD